VEKKSKIEMNPADRNNPCGEKEQDRDESGWPKLKITGCFAALVRPQGSIVPDVRDAAFR